MGFTQELDTAKRNKPFCTLGWILFADSLQMKKQYNNIWTQASTEMEEHPEQSDQKHQDSKWPELQISACLNVVGYYMSQWVYQRGKLIDDEFWV